MSFSPEIREKALVASARHCCVCHRYKGVKVEVHHIKSKSIGGKDDFKNAIPLCFDCHADAGHYNPKHPRGSKFSPKELKLHRDAWYKNVKDNQIESKASSQNLYCRYLICKNYEVLVEIAENKLELIPVENPLLVENEVLSFIREIVSIHPHKYRHSFSWGSYFKDKEEYLNLHPDAKQIDKSKGGLSFYDTIRIPSISELKKKKVQDDGIVNLLVKQGIPPEEIAVVVTFNEGCGDDVYMEEYKYRPLWGIFLAITNTNNRAITLNSLEVVQDANQGKDFRGFQINNALKLKMELPKAQLAPNSTAIIPIGISLAPIKHISPIIFSERSKNLEEFGHVQQVKHGGFKQSDLKDFRWWGPILIPERIGFNDDGAEMIQEFHELDLSNLYIIDRFWAAGSCPHVFFIRGNLEYVSEILTHCECEIGNDSFKVMDGVSSIIIAELEDEITEIEMICFDNCSVGSNLNLKQGDFLEWSVTPGTKVHIKGRYIPHVEAKSYEQNNTNKNSLVCDFLNRFNMSIRTSNM